MGKEKFSTDRNVLDRMVVPRIGNLILNRSECSLKVDCQYIQ